MASVGTDHCATGAGDHAQGVQMCPEDGSAAERQHHAPTSNKAQQSPVLNSNNNATEKIKPPPLRIMENSNQNQSADCPKTPQTPGPPSADFKRRQLEKERKIGHRRVDEEGQVTYKKFPTSQIMGSIQLAISHAIGSLASESERDLLMKDFMQIELVSFNKEGSSTTPAHHYSDFKFKVYAPIAFRYFRALFGIRTDDFLVSLSNEPLRELSNPGASGSVFYLTNDDNFIIKTVQHKEAEFLLKLLPGYYLNLNQNPRTLLPKFFGQYCYICGGKNVRFLVMNNLLPSYVKIHQKYDLKGSTYKRKASSYERQKSSPTYKDLDFLEHHPEGISLELDTYNALIKTIQRDCLVLESFKIMDYSLLVGVHNLDQANREKEERHREQAEAAALELSRSNAASSAGDSNGPAAGMTRSKSGNKQRIAAYSTALESIQADVDPIDQEEDIPHGGIPARNAKGERLLLYVGIIDILQSYRFRKKLEHTLKSVIIDGDTISVHRPGFYAQRFHDFMSKKVFKPISSLDLPEVKGPHRKFRNFVSSYIGLALKPPNRRNKPAIGGQGPAAREGRSSSISGTGATAAALKNFQATTKAGPGTKPEPAPFRATPTDNSRYLRTAVIKQAANRQSAILASCLADSHENDSATSSPASSWGNGSAGRTPPLSIGRTTPTHTEGTPSLTESSESEYYQATPLHQQQHVRHSHGSLVSGESGEQQKPNQARQAEHHGRYLDEADEMVVCTVVQAPSEPANQPPE